MSDNVDGMIRGLRDSGTTWAIQTAEELERLRRIEEERAILFSAVKLWLHGDGTKENVVTAMAVNAASMSHESDPAHGEQT